MPCSELFWLNFLEVFPKALGAGLGALPAILGFWGGLVGLLYWLDRRDDARRDAASRLGPRVAYLEQTSPKFPLRIWLAKPTLCGYTGPLSREPATNVRFWDAPPIPETTVFRDSALVLEHNTFGLH